MSDPRAERQAAAAASILAAIRMNNQAISTLAESNMHLLSMLGDGGKAQPEMPADELETAEEEKTGPIVFGMKQERERRAAELVRSRIAEAGRARGADEAEPGAPSSTDAGSS